MKKKYIGMMASVILLMSILFPGCNSKSGGTEYTPSSDVAVTKFTLKADKSVAANLDSLFFSLDLNNGLIYNADSLPVGTDVSKLVPVITFPSSVKKAIITMEDGNVRTGEVDYVKNPSDSIDFTGRVTLSLTAEDGTTTKEYRIKVNVHLMDPDSLWWDRAAVAKLPSRLPAPAVQKSLAHADAVWTMIEESDGTYTVASTKSPSKGEWDKKQPQFTFRPEVRSFTATDSAFYILSDDGTLYTSTDAIVWTSTSQQWQTIIGGYGSLLLGLRREGATLLHTAYPAGTFTECEASSEFPVKNSSTIVIFTSKWGLSPVGMITGGRKADGTLTGYTWAFDGNAWTQLSNNETVPTEGGVMIPYYTYLRNSTTNVLSEHTVILYMGGRKADGTLNGEVSMSFSNGIAWQKAGQSMTRPEYIPAMWMMDCAVVDTPLEANFAPEVWKTMQMPASGMRTITYTVDGYNVTWNCPYIYLFGGCNEEGELYDTIWKGVLNRLSFKPIM